MASFYQKLWAGSICTLTHSETRKQDGIWQKIQVQKKFISNNLGNAPNVLHQIYMYQKLYISSLEACVLLRDTNGWFEFGIWLFESEWFEAWLITSYGNRKELRRVTFSESRSYKNMLRKEYIPQEEKETMYMGLFVFISGVQYIDLRWEKNQVDKWKSLRKKKRCFKQE